MFVCFFSFFSSDHCNAGFAVCTGSKDSLLYICFENDFQLTWTRLVACILLVSAYYYYHYYYYYYYYYCTPSFTLKGVQST